jgi:hypothetical protein
MSLIKKSDVKNYLSTRTGARALPVRPVIHSDPTGYSEDGSRDAPVDAASASGAGVSGTGESAAPAADAQKPRA